MLTQRRRIPPGILLLAILFVLLVIPRSCVYGAEVLLLGGSDESATIELTVKIAPPVLADKAVSLIKALRQGKIKEWIQGPAPRLVVVPAGQEEHVNSYVLVTLWAY